LASLRVFNELTLLQRATDCASPKNLDFYIAFRMLIGLTNGDLADYLGKQTSPIIVQTFGLHTLTYSAANALIG